VNTRSLLLTLSLSLVPATASADILGAFVQLHGGYIKTDSDATWAYGPQVALQILGAELFLDCMFLEGNVAYDQDYVISSERSWSRAGLRYTLGLPYGLGADEADLFGDAALFVENTPPSARSLQTEGDPDLRAGPALDLGLRLEWEVAWPLVFGIQAGFGWHYVLFGGEQLMEQGTHATGLGYFKLDV